MILTRHVLIEKYCFISVNDIVRINVDIIEPKTYWKNHNNTFGIVTTSGTSGIGGVLIMWFKEKDQKELPTLWDTRNLIRANYKRMCF